MPLLLIPESGLSSGSMSDRSDTRLAVLLIVEAAGERAGDAGGVCIICGCGKTTSIELSIRPLEPCPGDIGTSSRGVVADAILASSSFSRGDVEDSRRGEGTREELLRRGVLSSTGVDRAVPGGEEVVDVGGVSE